MARRFVFPLETLLRVRTLREREAQRAVASKTAEIARLDQLNQQTAETITAQQQDLFSAQQQGSPDPLTLQRGRAWIAHLRRTIATRQHQKSALNEELKDLQAKLRDARTQTRIIEKLRTRRLNTYKRDRRRREQAEMDELAQQLPMFTQQIHNDDLTGNHG